ncbi:MAG TPA: tryptophan--tRNA ligase [Pyrinomonadaceae bacterium]|nr:tryptophan--tRNA ligase [Pyrinomonadaceae bacterium]
MTVETSRKPRVVSGIQPSGRLHIGNYIGAISQWIEYQERFDNLLFIADLHALTIPGNVNVKELRQRSIEVAGLYLACGIDPAKSLIFIQSDVPEHTYLAWVLTCCTPIGWLERMTQFKTKSEGKERVGAGLLTYPVLQAADILIYHADLVPVGEDQKQHVEITRDIAERFNHLFGAYFKTPEPYIPKVGARIMGLDNPEVKMSKSLAETSRTHAVGLLDPPNVVKKAIMSAPTDSKSGVDFGETSPGVSNLLTIYRCFSGASDETLRGTFEGKSYGFLKKELTELVTGRLSEIQTRYEELVRSGSLEQLLRDNAERAREMAGKTIREVRALTGVG